MDIQLKTQLLFPDNKLAILCDNRVYFCFLHINCVNLIVSTVTFRWKIMLALRCQSSFFKSQVFSWTNWDRWFWFRTVWGRNIYLCPDGLCVGWKIFKIYLITWLISWWSGTFCHTILSISSHNVSLWAALGHTDGGPLDGVLDRQDKHCQESPHRARPGRHSTSLTGGAIHYQVSWQFLINI